jgi:hypothetical protein
VAAAAATAAAKTTTSSTKVNLVIHIRIIVVVVKCVIAKAMAEVQRRTCAATLALIRCATAATIARGPGP